jgi:hypothetical protein
VPGASDVVTLVGTRNGRPVKLDIDLPAVPAGGQDRAGHRRAERRHPLTSTRRRMIYVYGEVQRPGVSRLERGMTVMQAMAQSGGLTQRGTERGTAHPPPRPRRADHGHPARKMNDPSSATTSSTSKSRCSEDPYMSIAQYLRIIWARKWLGARAALSSRR